MTGDKRITWKTITIIIVGLLVFALMIQLVPWFNAFMDADRREEFKIYVESFGIGGVFFVLGLQILQIVVAILPGEAIELLAGLTYGTWGGLLICLLGILIGSTIVFFTVRRFGKRLVEKMFASEKIKRLSFLQNTRNLEIVIFILFFIPGTPKDVLTYIAPLTKIKPSHFLIISFFARIPSVLSSTYAGTTIADGQWWKTAVIFGVMGIIGVVGIIINHTIVAKRSSRTKE